jgi:hypothetical protein
MDISIWQRILTFGKLYLINHSHSPGNAEFFSYFTEFFQNPERSGTYFFDQQQYATTVKECLQLCLCSHRYFSKGVIESASGDVILRRNKPWLWKGRLGVHSRRREGRKFKAMRGELSYSVPTLLRTSSGDPRCTSGH